MTNHDARNCPNNPGMNVANASSIQAPVPLVPMPPALLIQHPGQYHGQQWASTAPPGYYGPWNIPGGLYYGPNTQFPTQNWVPGPPAAFPGMPQVPYFPAPTQGSQGECVQAPGTQYPGTPGANHNS
jgi:hypothetical protein